MTEKEFFTMVDTMHMGQVDEWLADKEVTMGLVIITSIEGANIVTKVSRLKTPEDVAVVCRVITRDHRPVRRTVVFRSWLVPKDIAYDGGTDKQEMVMLLDGEEFPEGFEMSVGRKKGAKWSFKILIQADEGKYMYLGPEMIWMAYSAKLFTAGLEKAGITMIGCLPMGKDGLKFQVTQVPKGSKEPPPLIVDGMKVESIPMPQVPDGLQID